MSVSLSSIQATPSKGTASAPQSRAAQGGLQPTVTLSRAVRCDDVRAAGLGSGAVSSGMVGQSTGVFGEGRLPYGRRANGLCANGLCRTSQVYAIKAGYSSRSAASVSRIQPRCMSLRIRAPHRSQVETQSKPSCRASRRLRRCCPNRHNIPLITGVPPIAELRAQIGTYPYGPRFNHRAALATS